jgi:hypothetical protein
MDKQTFTPHGRDMDVLKNATMGTGVPASRHAKAAGKPAANDMAHLWESAFHAERGCLSGGISPRHPAPLPHH